MVPSVKLALAALAFAAGVLVAVDPGFAQQANQGRDCQTIRTCNFSRTGAVRGCLSSYSCRTCRLVNARCDIGGVAGTCRAVRCTWGG
jgi:hypothetical protein